jgi:hypothetical protein
MTAEGDCHCLCEVNHPERLGICQGTGLELTEVVQFEVSGELAQVIGDTVQVPMCPACAEASRSLSRPRG